MTIAPFAALESRLNVAVQQRLSNATVQLTAGGAAWAASYATELPERTAFADVADVPAHILSMWLAGIGDLAEGGELIITTRAWPTGQRCRITTPVVPDAGGWATFEVVPLTVVGAP